MPHLPDDVATLQQALDALSKENKYLREQMRLLWQRLYGKKSEKMPAPDPKQQPLLPFALFEDDAEEPPQAKPVETKVSAHTRKKGGRQPLPESLPRVEKVHDVAEHEKHCACGATKSRIGEEFSEELEMTPAKLHVTRHIRPKYACRRCEGAEDPGPTVVIAPPPPQIIPKSYASASLLAHIVTAKFVDSLPLYRQETQFARYGVELGRGTMCGWLVRVAEACGPLMKLLRDEILRGPLIGCDETTLQVLDEPGREADDESYMWAFLGGKDEYRAVEFVYDPTRESRVPATYLEKYEGAVQTDGYVGYSFLDLKPGTAHLGCMSHVRRKFIDVLKGAGKSRSNAASKPKSGGLAEQALHWIGELYGIERLAKEKNLNPGQIYTLRQELAKPKLEAFHEWLEKKSPHIPPRCLLGQAVSYALQQWHRLVRYIDDGLYRIDNNMVENIIRPFVVGRKNWLFSVTPDGARASATLYSLLVTAKLNDLEPYWYLRHLFEQLPVAKTPQDHRALLPQYINPTLVRS